MAAPSDAPHLPRSAPIDAYGNGGFAFAEMSHRGSLLCLPDAIWAWPVTRPEQIDAAALARVFAAASRIDTLLIGTGMEVWIPPQALREALRAVKVVLDPIQNCRLPVERLSRLIDEHQFDLYNDPMPTMAALESYINDTSSALFALGAGIVGEPSGETEHLARHAGLAQGMVQVMAALPRDA